MGVVDNLQFAYNSVFDINFWIPSNANWEELAPQSNDTANYTSSKELYVPICLAIVLLIIRFSLDSLCFRPFARWVGVKSGKPRKPPRIPVLEKVYDTSRRRSTHEEIVGLSKSLDLSERQVERWFRLRRAQDTQTAMMKYTETCWRFLYYLFSVCMGTYCLYDCTWIIQTRLLLSDMPHKITPKSWWYCMISSGFYWSCLFSAFTDVKRKDMKEMMTHHLVSITITSVCWIFNFHRPLSVGLYMFDTSDVLLEAVKLLKYSGKDNIAVIPYGLMTIVWFATRLVWFPMCMMRFGLVYTLEKYNLSPLYFVINGLLCAFFFLNVFWTYFIVKTAYAGIRYGPKVATDYRSSDEEVSYESEGSLNDNGNQKME